MTIWNRVIEENALRGRWWSPRCPAGRSCLDAEPRKPPSAVWTLEPASLPVPSTSTPPRPPWSTRRNPGPVWQPDPGSPSSTGPEPGKTPNRVENGVYLLKATSGTIWLHQQEEAGVFFERGLNYQRVCVSECVCVYILIKEQRETEEHNNKQEGEAADRSAAGHTDPITTPALASVPLSPQLPRGWRSRTMGANVVLWRGRKHTPVGCLRPSKRRRRARPYSADASANNSS